MFFVKYCYTFFIKVSSCAGGVIVYLKGYLQFKIEIAFHIIICSRTLHSMWIISLSNCGVGNFMPASDLTFSDTLVAAVCNAEHVYARERAIARSIKKLALFVRRFVRCLLSLSLSSYICYIAHHHRSN